MNILFILTSHDKLGDTGKKTGFWLEEFTSPYYYLLDKGANITLATPKGGQPPLDPNSDAADAQTASTERFKSDIEAQAVLAATHKLSDVKAEDFDAVFFPGGHGPLWDLTNDPDSIAIIQDFVAQQKPIAAVCHAPSVLIKVKHPDGTALVKGKKVTGFTNSEEDAVGLTDIVPFLLEDQLISLGGEFQRKEDWSAFAITDGNLITGQNPASSELVAEHLYTKLAHSLK
jgi:putative intracellular protease/amidase